MECIETNSIVIFRESWIIHFIIFSSRAQDSFPEEIFWSQLAIYFPEYFNIMSTKLSITACNC